jgi:hypothetical protein
MIIIQKNSWDNKKSRLFSILDKILINNTTTSDKFPNEIEYSPSYFLNF